MSRGTAVILAHTVFQIDNRVRKEAESLTAAGFDVVRVGFVRRVGDPEEESTDVGRILRIRKSWQVQPPDPSEHEWAVTPRRASRRGRLVRWVKDTALKIRLVDDLRHYFGRVEENQQLYRRAAPLEPAVVVACDLETLPAGIRLGRATGAFVVYDAHELYVELDERWSKLRRALYRRLERRLIGQADLVTTVSPLIAEEFESRYGVTGTLVVLNGPSETNDDAEPAHMPVRLLFQGGFAANRGLVPLAERMHRLRGQAVLTLQGFGEMEQRLRSVVSENHLEDVVLFAPPTSPEDVIRAGRQHDVGMVVNPLVTRNQVVAVPNKIMDYLGAGLALATVASPGILQTIDVDSCGVSFDTSRPDEMFDVLESLVNDLDRITAMKRCSTAISKAFTWDRQFAPVLDAIDQGLRTRGR